MCGAELKGIHVLSLRYIVIILTLVIFQLHSLYFVSSLSLIFFSFLHFFREARMGAFPMRKKKKNIEQVRGKINVRDVE